MAVQTWGAASPARVSGPRPPRAGVRRYAHGATCGTRAGHRAPAGADKTPRAQGKKRTCRSWLRAPRPRLGLPFRGRGHRRVGAPRSAANLRYGRSGPVPGSGPDPVPARVITVASGLSPSGPIHLGNLREVMTPHLVADEIRRRGLRGAPPASPGTTTTGSARSRPACPASTRPGPSTSASRSPRCPAPAGSRTRTGPSTSRRRWRTRSPNSASSSTASARPRSTPRAPTASRSCTRCAHRADIDAILDQYRTKKPPSRPSSSRSRWTRRSWRPPRAPARPRRTTAAAARAHGYFPYKPYCAELREGPHHRHRLRRRDHRADVHLRAAGTPRRCGCASSTAASWCGRSTGRCAGPTRA